MTHTLNAVRAEQIRKRSIMQLHATQRTAGDNVKDRDGNAARDNHLQPKGA